MRKHWFNGNVYPVLVLRLLLALLFFSLSRLHFWLFNLPSFNDLNSDELIRAFAGGLRFDIAAIIILNTPYILMNTFPLPFRGRRYWQLTANQFYYIFNILGFALNGIDAVYFRFTSKRMTADIFSFLGAGDEDIMGLLPRFLIDFRWEFITWALLSALFVLIATRIQVKRRQQPCGMRFFLFNTLFFLIAGFISIIGIRGGFQLRPFTIINAGQYASAKNVSLVLNTPFTIMKTAGHTRLKEVQYFRDPDALSRIYDPVVKAGDTKTGNGFRPFNVVLVIMESFGTEYVGALNGRSTGYTPSLDSIISHALVYRAYANGKQSIEALPAIVAGLPSLSERPYITSAYGSNNINSLASLLGDKGYVTAFFHGGRNGTMGFEYFIKMAGFDAYHGKDEYADDSRFDGHWGIYDEAFFDYFLNALNRMEKPFLGVFFSLSSHHPYMVPPEYDGIFDKGTLDIHESIMYADHSLGRFMRQAAQCDWFENTLFVITADHTSLSEDKRFRSRDGIYSIPLIFYMPLQINAGLSNDIAQQSDIMPSILGFLGYDGPWLAFGNNLFDSLDYRFSVNYLNASYQLLKDGYSLHYDGKRSTALYGLERENDPDIDLLHQKEEVRDSLETFLKALIQQYNHRMINNQLTPGGSNE
jgi:phosphoglycerol transferase MdoB-like AlkP superfamily enzyme